MDVYINTTLMSKYNFDATSILLIENLLNDKNWMLYFEHENDKLLIYDKNDEKLIFVLLNNITNESKYKDLFYLMKNLHCIQRGDLTEIKLTIKYLFEKNKILEKEIKEIKYSKIL